MMSYFSISCSLRAHSFLSISSIIFLRFSSCETSFKGGRVASQARFARARSIISTSAIPAGSPRPITSKSIHFITPLIFQLWKLSSPHLNQQKSRNMIDFIKWMHVETVENVYIYEKDIYEMEHLFSRKVYHVIKWPEWAAQGRIQVVQHTLVCKDLSGPLNLCNLFGPPLFLSKVWVDALTATAQVLPRDLAYWK